MKKGPLLCSLALLCLPLAACGEQEPQPMTPEEQLDVFAAHPEVWQAALEQDYWAYAVADLNQDGVLELISTESHGTGHFTDSVIYTAEPVKEEEDTDSGIRSLVGSSDFDKELGPVFEPKYDPAGGTAPMEAYRDENGAYYYVMDSFVKVDALTYLEGKRVFVMDGTETRTELLAERETVYTPDGETVTCRDAEGKEISDTQYETVAADRFDALQPMEARISWLETPVFREGDAEEILEALQTSYEGFSLMDCA